MAKRRILVVTFNAGGNWPPILALIEKLAGRGHEIRVMSDSVHEPAIAQAGAIYRRFRNAMLFDSSNQSGIVMGDRQLGNMVLGEELCTDVLAEVGVSRPDVLLVDFMLKSATAAAESTGIPTGLLWHTPYRAVIQESREAPRAVKRLNRLRRRLDLAPLRKPTLSTAFGEVEAILVFTYSPFDLGTLDLPTNVVYVGASACASRCASAYRFPWPETDHRPLVLVSYSTTFQDQATILQNTADALGDLPVKALFTLGHAISREHINLPTNAYAETFVPHSAVLPYADLVITHAGHGTVMAAVTAGVPLVCTPMGRDQFAVSRCVEQNGLGLIASKEASSHALKQIVSRALSDGDLRRRAREFAAQLDPLSGLRQAAEVVEGLCAIDPAQTRTPVNDLRTFTERCLSRLSLWNRF